MKDKVAHYGYTFNREKQKKEGKSSLKKRKDVYEMEEEKQGFICGNEKLQ